MSIGVDAGRSGGRDAARTGGLATVAARVRPASHLAANAAWGLYPSEECGP